MSVDWYSGAIIGVEIDPPYKGKNVRMCDHSIGIARFCPECGKPAFEVVEESIDGYDPDNGTWGEFTVTTGRSHEEYEYYVGLYATELCHKNEKWGRMIVLPTELDFNLIAERLRELLEPHKMWDASKFGLWSVLSVSF